VAGFKVAGPLSAAVFAEGYTTPTLHVLGRNDILVVEERSRVLIDVSLGKRVEEHDGGTRRLLLLLNPRGHSFIGPSILTPLLPKATSSQPRLVGGHSSKRTCSIQREIFLALVHQYHSLGQVQSRRLRVNALCAREQAPGACREVALCLDVTIMETTELEFMTLL